MRAARSMRLPNRLDVGVASARRGLPPVLNRQEFERDVSSSKLVSCELGLKPHKSGLKS